MRKNEIVYRRLSGIEPDKTPVKSKRTLVVAKVRFHLICQSVYFDSGVL